MKFNQVLGLALAAGLVLPVTNAYASELEDDQLLDQSVATEEEAEAPELLPADSPLIYETGAPVEDGEDLASEANDEDLLDDDLELEEESLDADDELEDGEEKVKEIIDELEESTEEIKEEIKSESRYQVELAEPTYIFDGQNLNLQTLRVTDKETEAISNVVSIREYAYILANTDLRFDVKIDGTNFYLKKGQNYSGGTTKKFLAEDLEIALVEEFTGKLIVDGQESEISGYFVDGEPVIRASLISKALDLRFRNDIEDSSKLLINSDKSDIAVPTVAELDEEIKKADYTVLFNWGPWCPWSRHEIPIMEKFAQYLMEQRNYNVQILGLVNKSENYTQEEISVLFDKNKSLWKNLGTDADVYAHVDELLGYRLKGFPTSFIVDKDLNKLGGEYFDYFDEWLELYLAENNLTEEEYEELYIQSFDDMEVYDSHKEIIYSNLLRYTIEGAPVSLADSHLLKEVNIANEDKVDSDDKKDLDKEDTIKAPEVKTEVKENKAPKAAKIAKKSDNPKTGVGSIAGVAALLGIASVGLKKIKRD